MADVAEKENNKKRKLTEGNSEDSIIQLRVKRLSDDAVLPKRGSPGSAGYDLARCDNG